MYNPAYYALSGRDPFTDNPICKLARSSAEDQVPVWFDQRQRHRCYIQSLDGFVKDALENFIHAQRSVDGGGADCQSSHHARLALTLCIQAGI